MVLVVNRVSQKYDVHQTFLYIKEQGSFAEQI